MNEPSSSLRWRFRLQLLTALAVLVLLVMALRARSERAGISASRDAIRGALGQLLELQHERYARTGAYATTLDSSVAWRPPAGVTLRFVADDDQTWRATATDSSLTIPPTTCGVYLGRPSAAPHRAVTEPGRISCW